MTLSNVITTQVVMNFLVRGRILPYLFMASSRAVFVAAVEPIECWPVIVFLERVLDTESIFFFFFFFLLLLFREDKVAVGGALAPPRIDSSLVMSLVMSFLVINLTVRDGFERPRHMFDVDDGETEGKMQRNTRRVMVNKREGRRGPIGRR